jgi:hypothetical protein
MNDTKYPRGRFDSTTGLTYYWQTVSFRSHLWHGRFPSHRTLDVRQLVQALIARRFRGRSDELDDVCIGKFARKKVDPNAAGAIDPVLMLWRRRCGRAKVRGRTSGDVDRQGQNTPSGTTSSKLKAKPARIRRRQKRKPSN